MKKEVDLFNIIKDRDDDLLINTLINVLKLKKREHTIFQERSIKNNGTPMSSIGG